MDVVSLFDGISCAHIGLTRAGVPIKSYKAYEIDKYAISVSKKNHPTIQQCGDVKGLKEKIPCDILIGGSPCTDLSISRAKREGLKGAKSSLFWEYVRIKKLLEPKWFVLENVASMKADDRKIITDAMGVEPILINASLVSAQRRKRLFWTNIPLKGLPEDKGILLKDILEPTVDEKYFTKRVIKTTGEKVSQGYRTFSIDGKSATLTAGGGGIGAKTGLYKIGERIRRLTPLECERLQSLPEGYTSGLSDTQRYKCCGNAFNCDVIAHIFRSLPRADA